MTRAAFLAGPVRLCVVADAPTLVAATARVCASPRWLAPAGPRALVELRLDRYEDATPETLAVAVAALTPARVVVTCRAAAEGGGIDGRPVHATAALHALLVAAHSLGVAYIDIEAATVRAYPKLLRKLAAPGPLGARTRLVVSYHADPSGPMPTDAQVADLWDQAHQAGACAFKLVVPADAVAQQLRAAAWAAQDHAVPLLLIVLGERGLWSRLLAGRARRPAPYTLVRLDDGPGVAPGQPTWADADALYRAWAVRPETPVFGVVGWPIAHSRSPALHRQAMDACGAQGVYLPFAVPAGDEFAAFLRELAPALGVRGLSVTAPHKLHAAAWACRQTPAVRAIGAANTLLAARPRRPGDEAHAAGWFAANTDALAAAETLAQAMPQGLSGRAVLVLGTGGAARAVTWGLAQAGAQVVVWGRRLGAAQALVDAFADLGDEWTVGRCRALDPEALRATLPDMDAVVHCTPVGMGAHVALLSAAELGLLPAHAVVFDTVYAPPDTALLQASRRAGLAHVGGLDMLRRQAQAQAEHFYDAPAPILGA